MHSLSLSFSLSLNCTFSLKYFLMTMRNAILGDGHCVVLWDRQSAWSCKNIWQAEQNYFYGLDLLFKGFLIPRSLKTSINFAESLF